jgi:hypothetical protein
LTRPTPSGLRVDEIGVTAAPVDHSFEGSIPGGPSTSMPWRAPVAASSAGPGSRHLIDERREVAGANTASKYLLLGHSLARHVLDAYDAWLDEVDRELA